MTEAPAPQPLRGRRVVEVLATSAGGVGTHVRAIVPVIAAAGASVGVCGAPATEELFGFTAVGAEFTPVGITAGLQPLADSRAVFQLRRALAGAEIIHAHGLRAGLVAAAARRLGGGSAPLVLTLHNALLEDGGRLHGALQAVEHLTIRSADLVLAVSSDLAENARRAGARDVRVSPVYAPPLPSPVRSRADVRRELGVADGRPLVVAIGRLHPQKGYDVLLDAVAGWADDPRLPTQPLVAIAGDGPLRAELADRITAGRLPVQLLGRRDDVADLLTAADVCVLPSRWEGTPLIAQEMLRAGRPLVATRTGGVPDLVGEGALLVPVGDAPALTDALVRVLTEPAYAEQLVEAGRAQAARWPDETTAARRIVAVYRELLGPPA